MYHIQKLQGEQNSAIKCLQRLNKGIPNYHKKPVSSILLKISAHQEQHWHLVEKLE